MRWLLVFLVTISPMLFGRTLQARVSRIEIIERKPFADGKDFGDVGPYEFIRGRLHYAVNPDHPRNQPIVDLQLAKQGRLRADLSSVVDSRMVEVFGVDPRNEKGEVQFDGDFILLKPVDLSRGNHRLLYDVNNRGNLLMLSYFNNALGSNRPTTERHAGDGWLMRQGYSLLWSAWNWDVAKVGQTSLRINLPVVVEQDGSPMTGLINAELAVQSRDGVTVEWIAWGGSRCYPVAEETIEEAVLTVRSDPDGERKIVPRDRWQFAATGPGGKPRFDPVHVRLPTGFEKGKLYELVYTAKHPRVVGLGLAAVRDAISFFHFESQDGEGCASPLAVDGHADPRFAYIFGISQSGRFITHMIYQGFHVDEQERLVFEGARPHVPGAGKGGFNYRFAQTTHHQKHLQGNYFPADHFPFHFTPDSSLQHDPLGQPGRMYGDVFAVAKRLNRIPKVLISNHEGEYWTRSASLLHTDVLGETDAQLHPFVRVYMVNGARHGTPSQSSRRRSSTAEHLMNQLDPRPVGRALLVALDRWVSQGTEPPPSRVPRIDRGELIAPAAHRDRFPQIPTYNIGGIEFPAPRLPGVNLRPPRVDYGRRFWTKGIQDIVPPRYYGPRFTTLVPAIDEDGNPVGGIRLPRLAVPLGTYQGFNPRRKETGAENYLKAFDSSFWPLATTRAERLQNGDLRPSIEERYSGKSDYVRQIASATEQLRQQRFLLDEDAAAIVDFACQMAWPPRPIDRWPFWTLDDASDLASTLRDLDVSVLSNDERQGLTGMISRDIERRRLLAIQRENMAWSKVKSRDDWERFRDLRLSALRDSLGQLPQLPKDLNIETTGRIEGDGYRIENIVFESRPGLLVTANLYWPAKAREPMPAVLFSHSHHNPKTQGELQDMGATWARHGWVVLVMDLLGHGERRQHPFVSSDQYLKPFRVGRQDYYFRYNVGLQLQLAGESLIGWMVWDLMRGVDLLCSREGVDEDRIALIGSVAGGGDPAAVAAALDPRIAAVAPFNFGGPQPDYPIPQNAESEFYYFGVAYWETTRCLRLGGRDGFAHWVIAASVAPRGLVYSHEFGWDRARDPVWPRLEKVFSFYDARDQLAVAAGRGHLKGRPPESTHCNNVGVVHRRELYPHLARWFDRPPPADEFQNRRDAQELLCITPAVAERLDPQPLCKLAGKLADERIAAARQNIASVDIASRRTILRDGWSRLLGNITPVTNPIVKAVERDETNGVAVERIVLEVEPGIVIPLVVIQASGERSDPLPVVMALADLGKQKFLAARPDAVSTWLEAGCAVCLPDVRGSGETSEGGSYGPRSTGTTLSCSYQVLGQTLLGSRLRDLRSVLLFLRTRKGLDEEVSLWGDSLAALNPPERSEVAPYGVDNANAQAEPSAGLLVLLTALFEDNVNAVYARGTFASLRSLLDSQFLYVPHDSVVPGALTVGDVADIAAALVPRPLLVECPVDGLNRGVPFDKITVVFEPTSKAYRLANASEQFSFSVTGRDDSAVWLLNQIKR